MIKYSMEIPTGVKTEAQKPSVLCLAFYRCKDLSPDSTMMEKQFSQNILCI